MFKTKYLIVILSLIIICFVIYKPLLNFFIDQSKNPRGPVGSIMTKIWNKTFDSMTDWGLSDIEINDNDIILDVGCGGGETINKLASKTPNGKVYGIDISNESVKSSLKRNEQFVQKGSVEIYEADVASLPFDNNTFNKVTAIQTHMYWDKIENGFKEIHRTLKKEGLLIMFCEKDKIKYHMDKYKTNEDMKKLLMTVGFEVTDISETGNYIRFIGKKL